MADDSCRDPAQMDPINLLVRPASPADAPRIAGLFREEAQFHQRLAGYYELAPDFDWAAYVRRLLAHERCRIFVAEHGGQIVGFIYVRLTGFALPPRPRSLLARLRRRKTLPPASPLKPVSWGVIEDCLVSEPYRRRKIGEKLVQRALAWLAEQGAQRVELGVLINNGGPASFWRKMGFETFRLLMHRDLG